MSDSSSGILTIYLMAVTALHLYRISQSLSTVNRVCFSSYFQTLSCSRQGSLTTYRMWTDKRIFIAWNTWKMNSRNPEIWRCGSGYLDLRWWLLLPVTAQVFVYLGCVCVFSWPPDRLVVRLQLPPTQGHLLSSLIRRQPVSPALPAFRSQ